MNTGRNVKDEVDFHQKSFYYAKCERIDFAASV